MFLGTGLIIAALSLLLWNRREDSRAGDAAESVLPQVLERIEEAAVQPEETEVYPDPYDPVMTQIEIDGYGYIGYLSIPAVELELPVMGQWDYERLKTAPCRFTGSTKTGDLVVCAHNFDKHFGRLQKLVPGDEVAFADMDGLVWRYRVTAVEVLEPDDVGNMTAGAYDLTLFTCTYGGASRVTVRCDRAEQDGTP